MNHFVKGVYSRTMVHHLAPLLLFLFLICSVTSSPTINEADRVIFAVDTSASMEMKQANFKIKQAITTWVKYFAPKHISVGVVQLKQDKEASLVNLEDDSAVLKLSQMLSQKALGGPCLQCGLDYANELLGVPTDKDAVLVLMEVPSLVSPHDTPQYALEEIKPKFRIYTLAITENAESNLEQLAEATEGKTDFVRVVSFARLLQSFSILPTRKDHAIIAAHDCRNQECEVNFEVDDQRSKKSVLQIFICPTSHSSNVTENNFDEEFNFEWDRETECWVAILAEPRSGLWQILPKSSEPVSVFAAVKSGYYPVLTCRISAGPGNVDASTEDVIVQAELDPTFSTEEFKIRAWVEAEDGSEQSFELRSIDGRLFSACVLPSKQTGRHTVACRASNTQTQASLLTAQAPSFKVEKWSEEWPVNKSLCIPDSLYQFTSNTSPSIEVSKKLANAGILLPIEMVVSTTASDLSRKLPETSSKNNEVQETAILSSTFQPDLFSTLHEDTEERDSNTTIHIAVNRNIDSIISADSTQVTIFIVGAIIIAEIVFIIYQCRPKSKESGQDSNNLIPYSVSYKDDFELRLKSMNYKDDEQEV